jgi:hypothetical protein
LKNNQIIKKIIALGLVLLFIFSITPKKYWHDLVVDHTDSYSFNLNNEPSVDEAGFNCHVDDLVVKSPFVEVSLLVPTTPTFIYSDAPTITLLKVKPKSVETKDSRGPPVNI